MKKIYAFLAAALISVCAFASKDVVPSDAVLADYYTPGTEVCACFFVPADMVCNDIVVTGSFISWSDDLAKCVKAKAVEGYDGWYVAAFEPEATPDAEKGIQAKPILLDAAGEFNWNYQVGAATVIRGGVQAVAGSYAGEIDLIKYGTDAPNVFTVDAWKQNPCDAVYHNYRIEVISDGCDGYVIPFIVGSFTSNWKILQMQVDQDKTMTLGAPVYYWTVKAPENAEYSILSAAFEMQGTDIVITDSAAWKSASYIEELVGTEWGRIYNGANFKLGAEVNVVWDLRVDTLRWARCAPDDREDVVVTFLAPAGAPDEVEIIGDFDDWAGTAMTKVEEGKYTATIHAKASDGVKFRKAGTWAVQIQQPDPDPESVTGWKDLGNLKVEDYWEPAADPKTMEIDLSDAAEYRWTPSTEGIENIVLTEKAQKVVVDGVIYIIRDNKMYNIHGAQVR